MLVLLVFLVAVPVAVAMTAVMNDHGRVAHGHTLRAHARLHHTGLHAGLHHTGLHHTGLHARLHHARLHHTGLHARLHHTRLHARLHRRVALLAGRHHTLWVHTGLLLHRGIALLLGRHHALRVHARLLHARLHRRITGLLHTGLHHAGLLHTRLHHLLLLHTRLHARLHHTRLHHAGLLHTRLHHARLHHTGLHHTGLLHTGLHHARLACTGRLGAASITSFPDRLEVNLTGLLSTVCHLEPLIDAVADAKSRKLEGSLANLVVCADILIEDFNHEVVANVLHLDVEGLVPDGRLARAILDLGLELLLARRKLDVRVHLTERLSVSCQPRLNHS